MPGPARDISGLLLAWRNGNQQAFQELIPVAYDELRRIARPLYRARNRRPPTASHGTGPRAYMRLLDASRVQWQNRVHFVAVSTSLMRRVLVGYARACNYAKRDGGAQHVSVDCDAILAPEQAPDLIALDEALRRLEALDARKSRVVELRFFGGLSMEEAADVLQVSLRTILSDWSFEKSWLLRQLTAAEPRASGTTAV